MKFAWHIIWTMMMCLWLRINFAYLCAQSRSPQWIQKELQRSMSIALATKSYFLCKPEQKKLSCWFFLIHLQLIVADEPNCLIAVNPIFERHPRFTSSFNRRVWCLSNLVPVCVRRHNNVYHVRSFALRLHLLFTHAPRLHQHVVINTATRTIWKHTNQITICCLYIILRSPKARALVKRPMDILIQRCGIVLRFSHFFNYRMINKESFPFPISNKKVLTMICKYSKANNSKKTWC